MGTIYKSGNLYAGGGGGKGTSLPAGGDAGQALIKASDADGDVEWGGAFPVLERVTPTKVSSIEWTIPSSPLKYRDAGYSAMVFEFEFTDTYNDTSHVTQWVPLEVAAEEQYVFCAKGDHDQIMSLMLSPTSTSIDVRRAQDMEISGVTLIAFNGLRPDLNYAYGTVAPGAEVTLENMPDKKAGNSNIGAAIRITVYPNYTIPVFGIARNTPATVYRILEQNGFDVTDSFTRSEADPRYTFWVHPNPVTQPGGDHYTFFTKEI